MAAVPTQHPTPARPGGRVVDPGPDVLRLSSSGSAPTAAREPVRTFGPDGRSLEAIGATVV